MSAPLLHCWTVIRRVAAVRPRGVTRTLSAAASAAAPVRRARRVAMSVCVAAPLGLAGGLLLDTVPTGAENAPAKPGIGEPMILPSSLAAAATPIGAVAVPTGWGAWMPGGDGHWSPGPAPIAFSPPPVAEPCGWGCTPGDSVIPPGQPDPSAVPAPGALGLFGLALVGWLGLRQRRGRPR